MDKIKIYIADDDEDDRMFIKIAINKVVPSATIIEAFDGLDLLGKLQGQRYEGQLTMILLDMNMPRLNGLEAVIKIKSEPNFEKIPTIMISTSENGELEQKAYELGIDSVVAKPVRMEEYEAIVIGLRKIYVDPFLT